MIKTWPLWIVAALLVGCASPPAPFTALGSRDAAGVPDGDFRIVSATQGTAAQGRYQHGRMQGRWVFFDSRHARVAEITYLNGAATGPYRTFFGSLAFPALAGKLQTEGRLQDGRVTGPLTGYEADGSGRVATRATFDAHGTPGATTGPAGRSASVAANDERFVGTLTAIALVAMR